MFRETYMAEFEHYVGLGLDGEEANALIILESYAKNRYMTMNGSETNRLKQLREKLKILLAKLECKEESSETTRHAS